MNKIVISRIFESFHELERALGVARKTLEHYENPDQKVIERLNQYEEILEKQRSLATALCGYASLNDWDEVSRHVKLINGLSMMIRDDAKELVFGQTHTPKVEDGQSVFM